jgi:pyruvate/2-oxoglutarate dehydrogenase complex dihydrolipoamide acyltransferase (E2) component
MGRTIDNGDNIIDSRDVIRRVEELETERQDLADAVDEAQEAEDDAVRDEADTTATSAALEEATAALTAWDESDEARELAAIKAFAEEGEQNLSDWRHGETLIADHYFTQYAQELAEDVGAVGRDLQWPLMHIDWDAAADALKADYTSLTWDGAEYWGRS